jgi:hypothetical protein
MLQGRVALVRLYKPGYNSSIMHIAFNPILSVRYDRGEILAERNQIYQNLDEHPHK